MSARNRLAGRMTGFRIVMGMSQESAALALDISRGSLSHYENGRREPDLETLIKVANLYNLSLDNLVGREWREQVDTTASCS